jgi:transglutaminase-like putative cysteine protease
MKRRTVAGIAILLAWGAGLGILVQHEYFRPRLERLAEAATRVTPGTMYYAAMQGGRQVGFASSTIDTANTTVTESDYFVAELPVAATMRRATARTNVTLSRSLRLGRFDLSLETDSVPTEMTGRVDGDSILVVHSSARPKSDDTRLTLAEPILLPTLVPLVVALSEKPAVGKRYVLPVFDPTTRTSRSVGYTIRAESLFVLSDSAVLDTTVSPPLWRAARPDTVRAWEVAPDSGIAIGFAGWVDEQGRIVATSQLGLELRREPYELAFRNWQNDPTAHSTDAGHVVGTTALAAGKTPRSRLDSLVVRLYNIDPKLRLRLNGTGQRASHDTIFVATTPDSLVPSTTTLGPASNSAFALRAANIARGSVDRPVVAKRLAAWVRDSIRPHVAVGMPTAQQILDARTGDCNELAQLFVALARSRGLSARPVTGLLYVDGRFYYHAWAEVLLKDWVPVDPMLGQMPADAAHIRLMQGLALRTDLIRRWAGMDVNVVSLKETPRKPSETSHR